MVIATDLASTSRLANLSLAAASTMLPGKVGGASDTFALATANITVVNVAAFAPFIVVLPVSANVAIISQRIVSAREASTGPAQSVILEFIAHARAAITITSALFATGGTFNASFAREAESSRA